MKAIETVYRNRRFRSRLEARWAVFFDAIGVDWEYEPEGYRKSDDFYLPDFSINTRNGRFFIEVKGEKDWLVKNRDHVEWRLSNPAIVDYPIAFLGDLPKDGNVFLFIVLFPTKAAPEAQHCFFESANGATWVREAGNLSRFFNPSAAIPNRTPISDLSASRLGIDLLTASFPYSLPDVKRAVAKAAGARFEHGETL